MAEKLAELERLGAQRLQVLDALYELSEGNPHATVLMTDVYARVGLTWEVGTAAYRYLVGERLIEGRDSHGMAITHAGVKEREDAIAGEGKRGTVHFPQPVVHHVVQNFDGPMAGAVQIGGQENVAHVKTASGVPAGDLATVLSQLREHANSLPDAERAVALEHVDKLHSEAAAESPNTVRMKVWLKGLEIFPSLMPVVASVLQTLSNVGA